MRIYFLGTNGWYDSQTGYTLSILVQTRKEFIILDAGGGIYKAERFLNSKKPIYIFLSHFHLDHIIGLHMLGKFKFPQGIDIIGPPGVSRVLNTIVNQPYSMPLRSLSTKVRVHDLRDKPKLNLHFEFKKLLHSSPCYGYRFYLEGKIISFCTDTGFCRNLLWLARNSDLLILESSLKPGEKNLKWPHLNPEGAAKIAKESGAKKLALVHFDSGLYLTMKDRKYAEVQAKKIFKNTFAANDNTELELK